MKNKRLTKRTDTDFIELVEETNGLKHQKAVKHAIQRLADFEDRFENEQMIIYLNDYQASRKNESFKFI